MNLLLALACATCVMQTTDKPVAEVMVLGTYHMANPGLDMVKSKIRDTFDADRQKEIAELLDVLAKYKPTKILVEALPDSPTLNEHYQQFVKGDYQLTASEIEQVGYRLAKRLGHEKLYGIDFKMDMDFDKVMGFAQANGMADMLSKIGSAVQQIGAAMEDMDRKYTVSQLLAIHNTPEAQKFSQSFYVEMVKASGNGEYPGADMLADWYRRNLRIYANMRKVIEPGDRVLVMFGSGHAYFLNHTIQESLDLKWVDPLKYLPKPPVRTIEIKG